MLVFKVSGCLLPQPISWWCVESRFCIILQTYVFVSHLWSWAMRVRRVLMSALKLGIDLNLCESHHVPMSACALSVFTDALLKPANSPSRIGQEHTESAQCCRQVSAASRHEVPIFTLRERIRNFTTQL